ncbi:MAG: SPOR domain-containing protein [Alcanivoracaceae bacterium]
MRWVFFSLLILNVVYLVTGLIMRSAPSAARPPSAVVAAAPASLTLVNEVGSQPARSSPAAGGMPPLCPVVGPWARDVEAQQAAQGLRRSGYRVDLDSLRVVRERLHWVHLPAEGDRGEALRLLRELQAKGVDSFIVAEGADANAISLGYFGNADSARGLKTRMRAAGYQAEIRETAREVTEYWLRIEGADIPDGGDAIRALLAANQQLSGNHVACQSALPPAVDENTPPIQ